MVKLKEGLKVVAENSVAVVARDEMNKMLITWSILEDGSLEWGRYFSYNVGTEVAEAEALNIAFEAYFTKTVSHTKERD